MKIDTIVILLLLATTAFMLAHLKEKYPESRFLAYDTPRENTTHGLMPKARGKFDRSCEADSDCVPAPVCHPTYCVRRPANPQKGMVCSMECRPGTLDCGQGECKCIDGKCKAVIGK